MSKVLGMLRDCTGTGGLDGSRAFGRAAIDDPIKRALTHINWVSVLLPISLPYDPSLTAPTDIHY